MKGWKDELIINECVRMNRWINDEWMNDQIMNL